MTRFMLLIGLFVSVIILEISVFVDGKSLKETECPPSYNIGYMKLSGQIGTFGDNSAAKAVDLNLAGTEGDSSQCAIVDATNNGKTPGRVNQGPWWYVDLGNVYQINNVSVYGSFNKTEKWEQIRVVIDKNLDCNPIGISNFMTTAIEYMVFSCNSSGQYLSVEKYGGYKMSLCEVEVTGHLYQRKDEVRNENCVHKCGERVSPSGDRLCAYVELPEPTENFCLCAIVGLISSLAMIIVVIAIFLKRKSTNIQTVISDSEHQIFTYLAQNLGNEWRALGLALGINYATMQQIQQDNVFITKNAVYQMLVSWLRMNNTEQKAMLELLHALQEVDRNDLVDWLQRKLSSVELQFHLPSGCRIINTFDKNAPFFHVRSFIENLLDASWRSNIVFISNNRVIADADMNNTLENLGLCNNRIVRIVRRPPYS